MNYLVYFLLVIAAVFAVTAFRKRRDQQILSDEVRQRGGQLLRLERVRKGSPFADTSRGWWAWRVVWQNGKGEQSSWALTTRDGLGEWRD